LLRPLALAPGEPGVKEQRGPKPLWRWLLLVLLLASLPRGGLLLPRRCRRRFARGWRLLRRGRCLARAAALWDEPREASLAAALCCSALFGPETLNVAWDLPSSLLW